MALGCWLPGRSSRQGHVIWCCRRGVGVWWMEVRTIGHGSLRVKQMCSGSAVMRPTKVCYAPQFSGYMQSISASVLSSTPRITS